MLFIFNMQLKSNIRRFLHGYGYLKWFETWIFK